MAYTQKELDKALSKYIKNHPHRYITIDELAEYTHISRATWYRNETAMTKIEAANKTSVFLTLKKGADLPTAKRLVTSCRSEEELIKMTQSLLDEIVRLRAEENKKKASEDSNSTALRSKLRDRDAYIRQLEDQIGGQVLDSYASVRPEDVADSMNAQSFKGQFDALFAKSKPTIEEKNNG